MNFVSLTRFYCIFHFPNKDAVNIYTLKKRPSFSWPLTFTRANISTLREAGPLACLNRNTGAPGGPEVGHLGLS